MTSKPRSHPPSTFIGAGKGTQCELLKQNYPCVHLSAGQLLREEAAKKDESQHAALIEECLVAGKIVPVEISLELLRNAMKASEARSVLFLIDGFPRNFDNLEGWTRVMANGGDAAAVWGVLSYDCPLSILEKRVMERSKESGRSDDNLDSLRRRFQTFQAETVPVVDILRLIENDTLLKVVDIAGDRSLEKVWEDTQKTMNTFIANDILSANVRLLEAVTRRDVDVYRNLCADEMFVDVHNDESGALLSAEQIFVMQEGTEDSELISSNIKCAEMTFVTGEKVSLSYDRTLPSGVSFKETRIWSHQGPKGWRMVHFSRAAIP
jgi:UMP-CMP kinase